MVIKMANFKKVIEKALEQRNNRSQWEKAVASMVEIIIYGCDDDFVIDNKEMLKKHCLNGADNWKQYSKGGNALIYNCDIVECFFTPSQQKRFYFDDGTCRDTDLFNRLLDIQARALFQAWLFIAEIYTTLDQNGSKIVCECPETFNTIYKSKDKYTLFSFVRVSNSVFLKVGELRRKNGMKSNFKYLKTNYELLEI